MSVSVFSEGVWVGPRLSTHSCIDFGKIFHTGFAYRLVKKVYNKWSFLFN